MAQGRSQDTDLTEACRADFWETSEEFTVDGLHYDFKNLHLFTTQFYSIQRDRETYFPPNVHGVRSGGETIWSILTGQTLEAVSNLS